MLQKWRSTNYEIGALKKESQIEVDVWCKLFLNFKIVQYFFVVFSGFVGYIGSAVIGFSCCGVPALIFCLHIYSVFFFVFFRAKLIK